MRIATVLLPAVACLALLAPSASAQLPPQADLSLSGTTITPGGPPALVDGPSECDDFNRANGAVGPNWTVMAGTFEVNTNQVHCTAAGNSWMLHNSGNAPWQSAKLEFDIDDNPSGASRYQAAVIGYNPATGEDIYVKVQNQTGAPGYSNYGFYHGFNGGGYGSWGGFGSFGAQVQGGHVKVWVDMAGDQVSLEIAHTGGGTTLLQRPGLLASGLGGLLGTQYGFGAWTSGSWADNWELNDGCGGGGLTLSLSGTCGGQMTATVNGATPNGTVAIVRAFGTGNFTIPAGYPCAGTQLGLNNTATLAGTATANGSGVATLGPVNVPAGACGNVYGQAVDLTSCSVSNVVLVQ